MALAVAEAADTAAEQARVAAVVEQVLALSLELNETMVALDPRFDLPQHLRVGPGRSWFRLFKHMDDDGSGKITYDELAGAPLFHAPVVAQWTLTRHTRAPHAAHAAPTQRAGLSHPLSRAGRGRRGAALLIGDRAVGARG